MDKVKAAKAIECLVAGETMQATADMIGVDLSTIKRWKADPEFRAELLQKQAEVIADFKSALPKLGALALTAFTQCLEGAVGETAKHKAAELVLRTIGVLGEKAEIEVKQDDTVELISIGLNSEDKVVELDT